MTAGNVEVVEQLLSSWNVGDPELFMEPYAEDAVLETPPNFPEGGTLTGFDAIKEFLIGFRQGWEEGTSVAVREITPAGEDRVLAEFVLSGTGEASGIETRLDTLAVFTLRDGKVVRAQFFFDRAEALSAAGLED